MGTSLSVWDCNFLQQHSRMQLFMNGSKKSGRDQVVGESTPPPNRLYCYCGDHSQLSAAPSFISENDCSQASWSATLLQSFNVFKASKMCLQFVKNKLSCFQGYFVFLLQVFCQFL